MLSTVPTTTSSFLQGKATTTKASDANSTSSSGRARMRSPSQLNKLSDLRIVGLMRSVICVSNGWLIHLFLRFVCIVLMCVRWAEFVVQSFSDN